MEDKKPRILDILRLIVGLLTFAGALFVGGFLFLWFYGLFTGAYEDAFSGLVFIFIIPLIVGTFAYSAMALKWIKRYGKNKNIPLIQRTTKIGESVVKIVVVGVLLNYLSIPFVIYWGLDLIEAIMRKNLAERIKNSNPEPTFKTNQTNPIGDKHYCRNCGSVVDYRYSRFCEYCGAEIEYRK